MIRGLPCCSQTYAVAVSHPDLSIDTPFRRVRPVAGEETTVSFRGIPYVTVPDVTATRWVPREGYIPLDTYAEAGLRLLGVGLPAERVWQRNVIPELNGRVAGQSPGPGTRRTQGSPVRVTVYESTHERVSRVVGQPWRTAAEGLARSPGRFRPVLGRPQGFYQDIDGNDITSIRHHFRDPAGNDIHRCHSSELGNAMRQTPYLSEQVIPGMDSTWRTNASLAKGADVVLEVCVQHSCDLEGCRPLLTNLRLPAVGEELP